MKSTLARQHRAHRHQAKTCQTLARSDTNTILQEIDLEVIILCVKRIIGNKHYCVEGLQCINDGAVLHRSSLIFILVGFA